jgi:hypothetical protein
MVSIVPFGRAHGAYTTSDCVKCHKEGSTDSRLHISIEEFRASAHGEEITCEDCHTNVEGEDHLTKTVSERVDCLQECHEKKNTHGLTASIERRPKCYNCHTKHNILEKTNIASSVYSGRLKETCKDCHALECGNTGYFGWFPSIRISSHGKDDFSQQYESGNCLGCHQEKAAHGEGKPINDQQCYTCHFDSQGQDALWGNIHVKATKEHPSIFAAATLYQLFVVALLWGGFRYYTRKFSEKRKR